MSQLSYRSIVATVGGQVGHDQLTDRIDALRDVTVRRAALRRTGARRRRRLDTPTFESRIVVELVGAASLDDGPDRPYRGVSGSELDALVLEVGAHQRAIDSASVSFVAEAPSRRDCENLATQLGALASPHDAELRVVISERDATMLDGFELHGRATGKPQAIAHVVDALTASPWATWKMRTRWHDAR